MRKNRQSGQALVEFALVLPLLMLLIFGIISYGLYINANVTIQEAARIGARTLALGNQLGCPGDSAALQEQALQSSTSPSPSETTEPSAAGPSPVTVYGVVDDQINDGFGMSVNSSSGQAVPFLTWDAQGTDNTVWEYPDSNDSFQKYATVEVFYPYHPIVPIPGLLPSTIMLHQTYSMMVQTPQSPSALSSPPSSPPSGYNGPPGADVVSQVGGCPTTTPAYPNK